MTIINELTADQEELLDAVAKEYIDDLTVPREPVESVIRKWVTIVYGLFDKPMPDRLEIVGSPYTAKKLAKELGCDADLDCCGTGHGGWVSFYDYCERVGALDPDVRLPVERYAEIGVEVGPEARDVFALRDFGRVAWDTLLLDECAIVVRRPTALRLDEQGNLHSTTSPCIEWADGEKDWAFHGTWVPERMISAPRTYSRAEYLAITNTEERRALSELGGWAWVSELLGSKSLDTWTDPVTSLPYELLACGELRLLRKRSPTLKDGSRPYYLEPVHEELRTAQAARKWQATTMTAAECEADPTLRFGREA